MRQNAKILPGVVPNLVSFDILPLFQQISGLFLWQPASKLERAVLTVLFWMVRALKPKPKLQTQGFQQNAGWSKNILYLYGFHSKNWSEDNSGDHAAKYYSPANPR